MTIKGENKVQICKNCHHQEDLHEYREISMWSDDKEWFCEAERYPCDYWACPCKELLLEEDNNA